MAHLEFVRYASLKKGMALTFDGTAAINPSLFIALREVLPQSPLFAHTSKPK